MRVRLEGRREIRGMRRAAAGSSRHANREWSDG
jgi:hypothetical protein